MKKLRGKFEFQWAWGNRSEKMRKIRGVLMGIDTTLK
jgi:hypothetical protein